MKPAQKSVRRMNPTQQVMKQGSAQARRGVTEDVPGFRKIKRPVQAKRKTK